MSRKLKYLIFFVIFGVSFWILSGKISSSKERSKPTSLWSSFSKKEDKDQDGLTDKEEKELGTDPENPDTDGDKILDGIESKSGYDPLKKMAEDPKAVNRSNSNENSNSNANTNGNTNGNLNQNQNGNGNANRQTKVMINGSPSGVSSGSGDSVSQSSGIEGSLDKINYTEKTLEKSEALVAKYQLYTTPFEKLETQTKAQVEQEVAEFIEEMLNRTKLNFAFSVPEEKLNLVETEVSLSSYLMEVKSILRRHDLVKEDQNIEDGIKQLVSELSQMSKTDIGWDKINVWKKEIVLADEEISKMTVSRGLKDVHVRMLRITGALKIVMDNLDENDYFRSFISAGRAERVNEEIKKFVEELEKFKRK